MAGLSDAVSGRVQCVDVSGRSLIDSDHPPASMVLAEVMTVLQAVETTGCRYWLEGGWGVDALLGRQTRPHRDLDVDLEATYEAQVLAVLQDLGYTVETDWRPNRVELHGARGRVDLHPLLLDVDGSACQAILGGGGYHRFEPSWFTIGNLGGRPVPCVSAAAQRIFREGYTRRPVDRHDLDMLDQLDRR